MDGNLTFVFDRDGEPCGPGLSVDPDERWCDILIHEGEQQIDRYWDLVKSLSHKQLRIAHLWLALFVLFSTGGFVMGEVVAVYLAIGFASGLMVSVLACVPHKCGPLGVGLSDFNNETALRLPVLHNKQVLISTYEEIIRRWTVGVRIKTRWLRITSVFLGVYTFISIVVIALGFGNG